MWTFLSICFTNNLNYRSFQTTAHDLKPTEVSEKVSGDI